jgi:hypothetical protein
MPREHRAQGQRSDGGADPAWACMGART